MTRSASSAARSPFDTPSRSPPYLKHHLALVHFHKRSWAVFQSLQWSGGSAGRTRACGRFRSGWYAWDLHRHHLPVPPASCHTLLSLPWHGSRYTSSRPECEESERCSIFCHLLHFLNSPTIRKWRAVRNLRWDHLVSWKITLIVYSPSMHT